MHRAKECGKARYEVFGRDMQGESMSRLKMETDLRNACERDELFVDYQPIVSLGSRTLIGSKRSCAGIPSLVSCLRRISFPLLKRPVRY